MQDGVSNPVRRYRLEKGWSQEQLAQLSGLSVRTIQRIEGGSDAGLESLKCLAAVFETDISKLTEQQAMSNKEKPDQSAVSPAKNEAIEYVQNVKAFYLNVGTFVVIMPCLYLLNIYTSPDVLWVKWVAVSWGAAFILHGLVMFGLYGVLNNKWEQRKIKQWLDREE